MLQWKRWRRGASGRAASRTGEAVVARFRRGLRPNTVRIDRHESGTNLSIWQVLPTNSKNLEVSKPWGVVDLMRLHQVLLAGVRAVRREQWTEAVALLTPQVSQERNAESAGICYYLGLCWRALHQRSVAAGLFARAMEAAVQHGRHRLAARCRSELLWELLSLQQNAAAQALLQESAHYTATHPRDRHAQLRHENLTARYELLSGRPLEAASRAIEVAARAHAAERLLALETVLLAAEQLGDAG